jgi:hypothetical protein
MERIFEIRDAEEGGFCAHALGHAIFTQAETGKSFVSMFWRRSPCTSKMRQHVLAWCKCITSRTS